VITRIEAHNYRCFPKLAVDLDRYHVLAGANGAGKTTLLDIPVLVGDMLGRQGIVGAFLERQDGGRSPRASTLTDVLHKGQGDTIAFAFEAELPRLVLEALDENLFRDISRSVPTHLRYELRLEITPHEMRVIDEYMFLFPAEHRPAPGQFAQGRSIDGTTLGRSDWQSVIHREGGAPTRFVPESSQLFEYSPLRPPSGQLALGAVPPDQAIFPAALWFADLLRGGVAFFDPDWETLRRPAPPGDPAKVIPSGQNLPWLALRMQANDLDEFTSWVDHVRTALPQIKGIRAIEREEDHYAYFSVEYNGGYHVTSSGLSDGTLRVFALTLLPFLDDGAMPRLLATEEPENGIHPRAIETVLESLSSLFDSQVLVSTHSPIALAHTQPRDILVTRLEGDGSVTVVTGDQHPRLRDWQGEVDLGTLFAAGVLS
jgi:predicted ATPase